MQINIVPIRVRKNPAQLKGPYKITDLTFSNAVVVGIVLITERYESGIVFQWYEITKSHGNT